MHVYISSEPGLWTVGFYEPNGKWHPVSDHHSSVEAATKARHLNGGAVPMDNPEDYSELLAKANDVSCVLADMKGAYARLLRTKHSKWISASVGRTLTRLQGVEATLRAYAELVKAGK